MVEYPITPKSLVGPRKHTPDYKTLSVSWKAK
jgi:hypothetical protein